MRGAELDSGSLDFFSRDGGCRAVLELCDWDGDEPDDDGDRDTEPLLPTPVWLELDEELAVALADQLLRKFGAR